MKSIRTAWLAQYLVLALLVGSSRAQEVKLGDKTYFVDIRGGGARFNWFAANNFCASKGMHLLTVESVNERNALYLYLLWKDQLSTYYWTSGNDLAETGKWVWGATGKPFSFDNGKGLWNDGQPDNAYEFGEHCVQTWHHNLKLNDVGCQDPLTNTICEKRNDEAVNVC